MRDWYQALVSAKVRDKQEADAFRVAVVSGKVRCQSVGQSVSHYRHYHTPSMKHVGHTHAGLLSR